MLHYAHKNCSTTITTNEHAFTGVPTLYSQALGHEFESLDGVFFAPNNKGRLTPYQTRIGEKYQMHWIHQLQY